MPNSATATGEFSISIAEFSNVALVDYTAQTSLTIDEFDQVGTSFEINETTDTLSWIAGSGYKSLMKRMNGSYADNVVLLYQYLNFDATVTTAMTIEFNIVGTKYSVNLTPEVTSYQIDLGVPSSGNPDLWKFATGFNLLLTVDTTAAGQIVFGPITLGNTEQVIEEDIIDFNTGLSNFNGMTATAVLSEGVVTVDYTKTATNSLVYYLIDSAVKDGKIASDYAYINLRINSADTTEFLIELSGYSSMTHYVTLSEGSLDLTLVLNSLMLAILKA